MSVPGIEFSSPSMKFVWTVWDLAFSSILGLLSDGSNFSDCTMSNNVMINDNELERQKPWSNTRRHS
jgi:hypothetical protein